MTGRMRVFVYGGVGLVAVVLALVFWRPLSAWFTGRPLGGESGSVTATAGPYSLAARLDPDPPGTRGDALVLDVRDADGKPVDDAHVELQYDMPAMGTMAEMKGGADVAHESGGRYRAKFDLPMGGTWTLLATIHGGAGAGSVTFTTTVGSKGLVASTTSASGPIDHYTCSMHPSVKQQGPGKCPICSMDLTPVTREQRAAGVVTIDQERRQLIGVRTEAVAFGPMRSTFRAVGRVAYDESRLSDVSLKTRGWITKLAVSKTGERVARGQTLLAIYSPEVYAAEQDLLVAGADERLARAARQHLHLLGVPDAEIDSVSKRGTPAESVAVPAPASGFVVEKNVVEGAAVEAGMRLYRIAELDKVWIEAEVFETDLPNVRAGQPATVTLDYVPGRTFDAKVAYVYPYVDDKTRTGRARVEVANKELELRPGMYASVELTRGLGERVQVPAAAVVYTGPRKLVFLDLGAGRFEPREVSLGAESGGRYEVLAGLEKGDVVATSGVFLIAAEARITTTAKYWEPQGADAAAPSTSSSTMPMPVQTMAPRAPMPPSSSYTCPMHPEIEQSAPGACPKCGMPLDPKKRTP